MTRDGVVGSFEQTQVSTTPSRVISKTNQDSQRRLQYDVLN
jgi:hypothetical protein